MRTREVRDAKEEGGKRERRGRHIPALSSSLSLRSAMVSSPDTSSVMVLPLG